VLHKQKLTLKKASTKGNAEGLWAISYADFLMVLLSFFIIFFSMDGKNKGLSKVFVDLQKIGQITKQSDIDNGLPENSKTTDKASAKSSSEVLKSLSNKFSQTFLVDDKGHDKIVINLPENIFTSSSFNPPVEYLNILVEQIRPHETSIRLKVIGHSDSLNFANKGKRLVNDNLTLSGIRATYAANYLKAFYPKLQISAEADDQNLRVSRTLSIEVYVLGEVK